MSDTAGMEREFSQRLEEERERTAEAEKHCWQLQMQLEQQEAEFLELQAGLMREMQAKLTAEIAKVEKKYAAKTLPPVWHVMARSRAGRILCKLFRWYCALRHIRIE